MHTNARFTSSDQLCFHGHWYDATSCNKMALTYNQLHLQLATPLGCDVALLMHTPFD